MFDLLNVVGSLAQFGMYAVQAQFVIMNMATVDLPPSFQATPQVQAVQFKRWRETDEGPCIFKGVITPYAQDWSEESEDGMGNKRAIPATPDRIKGYAIVLDKKVCGNKVTEVAYVDSYFGGLVNRMVEGLRRDANDLTMLRGEARPKWLNQVADRLEAHGYKAEAAAARTPFKEVAPADAASEMPPAQDVPKADSGV